MLICMHTHTRYLILNHARITPTLWHFCMCGHAQTFRAWYLYPINTYTTTSVTIFAFMWIYLFAPLHPCLVKDLHSREHSRDFPGFPGFPGVFRVFPGFSGFFPGNPGV